MPSLAAMVHLQTGRTRLASATLISHPHHCRRSIPTLFNHLLQAFLQTRITTSDFNMVADALVYHPVVAHYMKFVATTGKQAMAVEY